AWSAPWDMLPSVSPASGLVPRPSAPPQSPVRGLAVGEAGPRVPTVIEHDQLPAFARTESLHPLPDSLVAPDGANPIVRAARGLFRGPSRDLRLVRWEVVGDLSGGPGGDGRELRDVLDLEALAPVMGSAFGSGLMLRPSGTGPLTRYRLVLTADPAGQFAGDGTVTPDIAGDVVFDGDDLHVTVRLVDLDARSAGRLRAIDRLSVRRRGGGGASDSVVVRQRVAVAAAAFAVSESEAARPGRIALELAAADNAAATLQEQSGLRAFVPPMWPWVEGWSPVDVTMSPAAVRSLYEQVAAIVSGQRAPIGGQVGDYAWSGWSVEGLRPILSVPALQAGLLSAALQGGTTTTWLPAEGNRGGVDVVVRGALYDAESLGFVGTGAGRRSWVRAGVMLWLEVRAEPSSGQGLGARLSQGDSLVLAFRLDRVVDLLMDQAMLASVRDQIGGLSTPVWLRGRPEDDALAGRLLWNPRLEFDQGRVDRLAGELGIGDDDVAQRRRLLELVDALEQIPDHLPQVARSLGLAGPLPLYGVVRELGVDPAQVQVAIGDVLVEVVARASAVAPGTGSWMDRVRARLAGAGVRTNSDVVWLIRLVARLGFGAVDRSLLGSLRAAGVSLELLHELPDEDVLEVFDAARRAALLSNDTDAVVVELGLTGTHAAEQVARELGVHVLDLALVLGPDVRAAAATVPDVVLLFDDGKPLPPSAEDAQIEQGRLVAEELLQRLVGPEGPKVFRSTAQITRYVSVSARLAPPVLRLVSLLPSPHVERLLYEALQDVPAGQVEAAVTELVEIRHRRPPGYGGPGDGSVYWAAPAVVSGRGGRPDGYSASEITAWTGRLGVSRDVLKDLMAKLPWLDPRDLVDLADRAGLSKESARRLVSLVEESEWVPTELIEWAYRSGMTPEFMVGLAQELETDPHHLLPYRALMPRIEAAGVRQDFPLAEVVRLFLTLLPTRGPGEGNGLAWTLWLGSRGFVGAGPEGFTPFELKYLHQVIIDKGTAAAQADRWKALAAAEQAATMAHGANTAAQAVVDGLPGIMHGELMDAVNQAARAAEHIKEAAKKVKNRFWDTDAVVDAVKAVVALASAAFASVAGGDGGEASADIAAAQGNLITADTLLSRRQAAQVAVRKARVDAQVTAAWEVYDAAVMVVRAAAVLASTVVRKLAAPFDPGRPPDPTPRKAANGPSTLHEHSIDVATRVSAAGDAFVDVVAALGRRWLHGVTMHELADAIEEFRQALKNPSDHVGASISDERMFELHPGIGPERDADLMLVAWWAEKIGIPAAQISSNLRDNGWLDPQAVIDLADRLGLGKVPVWRLSLIIGRLPDHVLALATQRQIDDPHLLFSMAAWWHIDPRLLSAVPFLNRLNSESRVAIEADIKRELGQLAPSAPRVWRVGASDRENVGRGLSFLADRGLSWGDLTDTGLVAEQAEIWLGGRAGVGVEQLRRATATAAFSFDTWQGLVTDLTKAEGWRPAIVSLAHRLNVSVEWVSGFSLRIRRVPEEVVELADRWGVTDPGRLFALASDLGVDPLDLAPVSAMVPELNVGAFSQVGVVAAEIRAVPGWAAEGLGLSVDLMTLFEQTGRVASDVATLANTARLSVRELVSASVKLGKEPRLVSLLAQIPGATATSPAMPLATGMLPPSLPALRPGPVDLLVARYPQWAAELWEKFRIEESEIWDLSVMAPAHKLTFARLVAMPPKSGREEAAKLRLLSTPLAQRRFDAIVAASGPDLGAGEAAVGVAVSELFGRVREFVAEVTKAEGVRVPFQPDLPSLPADSGVAVEVEFDATGLDQALEGRVRDAVLDRAGVTVAAAGNIVRVRVPVGGSWAGLAQTLRLLGRFGPEPSRAVLSVATGFGDDAAGYLRLAQIFYAHYDVLLRLGQDWRSGRRANFNGGGRGQSYGYDSVAAFLRGLDNDHFSPLRMHDGIAVFHPFATGLDLGTIQARVVLVWAITEAARGGGLTDGFWGWRFERPGEHVAALREAAAGGGAVVEENGSVLRLLGLVSAVEARSGVGRPDWTAMVAALFHATSWAPPLEGAWVPPLGLGPVLDDPALQLPVLAPITQAELDRDYPELGVNVDDPNDPLNQAAAEGDMLRAHMVMAAAGFAAVFAEVPGDMVVSDAYLQLVQGRRQISTSVVAEAYRRVRAWEADDGRDADETLSDFLSPDLHQWVTAANSPLSVDMWMRAHFGRPVLRRPPEVGDLDAGAWTAADALSDLAGVEGWMHRRIAAGLHPVPHFVHDATGGLASAGTGRRFSVSIPVTLDSHHPENHWTWVDPVRRRERIMSVLDRVEVGPVPWQLIPGSDGFRLQTGLLSDSPEVWRALGQAFDTIRFYGGQPTADTSVQVTVASDGLAGRPENLVAVSNLFDSHLDVLWRLGGDPVARSVRGLDGRDPYWSRPSGVGSVVDAVIQGHSRGALRFDAFRGGVYDSVVFGFAANTMVLPVLQAQMKVLFGVVAYAESGGAARNVITAGTQVGVNARLPQPDPTKAGPWVIHRPGDLAGIYKLLTRIFVRNEDRIQALALFYLNPWHPGTDVDGQHTLEAAPTDEDGASRDNASRDNASRDGNSDEEASADAMEWLFGEAPLTGEVPRRDSDLLVAPVGGGSRGGVRGGLGLKGIMTAALGAFAVFSPAAAARSMVSGGRAGSGDVAPGWSGNGAGEVSGRVVMYYQTHFDAGEFVSPLGLVEHDAGVTNLIVGAVHFNDSAAGEPRPRLRQATMDTVIINNDAASSPRLGRLWYELSEMQRSGVRVSLMIGGSGGGFAQLKQEFDIHYPNLRALLKGRRLDGVDLNIEESVGTGFISQLITSLRADFGPDFDISLSPTFAELFFSNVLSDVSYGELSDRHGSDISFFNVQFYNGRLGALDVKLNDLRFYPAAIEGKAGRKKKLPPEKVVAGVLANPEDGASGYIDPDRVRSAISALRVLYPSFGGIFGWEYYRALPGGLAAPWEWARIASAAMSEDPRLSVRIRVSNRGSFDAAATVYVGDQRVAGIDRLSPGRTAMLDVTMGPEHGASLRNSQDVARAVVPRLRVHGEARAGWWTWSGPDRGAAVNRTLDIKGPDHSADYEFQGTKLSGFDFIRVDSTDATLQHADQPPRSFSYGAPVLLLSMFAAAAIGELVRRRRAASTGAVTQAAGGVPADTPAGQEDRVEDRLVRGSDAAGYQYTEFGFGVAAFADPDGVAGLGALGEPGHFTVVLRPHDDGRPLLHLDDSAVLADPESLAAFVRRHGPESVAELTLRLVMLGGESNEHLRALGVRTSMLLGGPVRDVASLVPASDSRPVTQVFNMSGLLPPVYGVAVGNLLPRPRVWVHYRSLAGLEADVVGLRERVDAAAPAVELAVRVAGEEAEDARMAWRQLTSGLGSVERRVESARAGSARLKAVAAEFGGVLLAYNLAFERVTALAPHVLPLFSRTPPDGK
ncbi:MAG: hypothetical protein QOE61_460, partial [Micromonosporaceae bacterium]|nr:hypothetical protein [Micromonosporaceae bacterium]